MIDHVTYQVFKEDLHDEAMTGFFSLLGFEEIDAAEEIKMGWDVRWWVHGENMGSAQTRINQLKPEIHLVADDRCIVNPLGLAHFCVTGVGEQRMAACRGSGWLEHEREGSGRLWLAGPGGIRVEVRS